MIRLFGSGRRLGAKAGEPTEYRDVSEYNQSDERPILLIVRYKLVLYRFGFILGFGLGLYRYLKKLRIEPTRISEGTGDRGISKPRRFAFGCLEVTKLRPIIKGFDFLRDGITTITGKGLIRDSATPLDAAYTTYP
ncbi:hypothetical protein G7Y89_g1630 [Cudoniella acicularis]|uniref:Uncharacterized protein n=1 Tax=Cudoniella acicularis TaxID=354080 RepID=A0A8H4W7Q2_9HELO|nr:hypothetical protein G7Y89_g1630 [Cudoniella acicularis]